MKQPLVSFVVPCYNYGRYLDDCLRSIFSQAGSYDLEVIVINDASPDNTRDVINTFKDSRLKVIEHKTNQGHVVAITSGLTQATGRYVARIDADDRYRSDFLVKTVPVLEKNPDVGAVFGRVRIIGSSGEVTGSDRPPFKNPHDQTRNMFLELLQCNFICAPTLIARNELWKKALPIPQGYSHSDWFLNLQIARRTDFHFVGSVIADYRVHSSNLHSSLTMNRNEEPTTFKILDKIYSETEEIGDLDTQKRKIQKIVYAEHYRDLALKYYGAGYFEEFRRCSNSAIHYNPFLAFDRHLFRAQMGRIFGKGFLTKVRRAVGGKE